MTKKVANPKPKKCIVINKAKAALTVQAAPKPPEVAPDLRITPRQHRILTAMQSGESLCRTEIVELMGISKGGQASATLSFNLADLVARHLVITTQN